jgi:hypothetical protein
MSTLHSTSCWLRTVKHFCSFKHRVPAVLTFQFPLHYVRTTVCSSALRFASTLHTHATVDSLHLCTRLQLTLALVFFISKHIYVTVLYRYLWYAPWVERAAARIWSALQPTISTKGDTPHDGESPTFTVDSPQADVAHDVAVDNIVVCLHIRRGDKLSDTVRYPQLAAETSAQGVLAAITPWIAAGSVLYIATDEPRASHFYELLQKRYRVSALDSFGWVVSAQQLLPSSLALVDYAVLNKCTKLINTFADEPARGFARSDISLSQSNK